MPDRDDPSLGPMAPGEIARNFRRLDESFKEVNRKLDNLNVVGRAEYVEAQRHLDTRVRAIEEDVKEIKDTVGGLANRDDDRRRWMISTFVAPLIMAVLVVALMNALKL